MASLYDAVLVRGQLRYRLNKVFVGADKVPENIKKLITADNIVDENGLIVVDEKTPEAKQQATEEAENEEKPKLQRIDGDKQEAPAEPAPAPDPAPTAPPEPQAPQAPVAVDDSANQTNPTPEEGSQNDTGPSPQDPSKNTTAPVVPETPAPDPAPNPPVPVSQPQAPVAPQPAAAPTQPVIPTYRSKVPQSSPGMGFPRKHGKTVDIFDLQTPHTHVKLVGGHAVPLSRESFETKTEGMIISRLMELGFEITDYNELERLQAAAGAAGPVNGLLMEDDEVDEDIRLG